MNRPIVLILLSSHIRTVSEEEVLPALPDEAQRAQRRVVAVDLRPHALELDSGGWGASDAELRRAAAEVHDQAEALGDPELHFFGVAEVPHLVALGAYIGDERHIVVHDMDRDSDRDQWAWREEAQTLEVHVRRLPAETISQSGDVMIRIAVSSAVTDEDVAEYSERGSLADILLTLGNSVVPQRGVVHSLSDVAAIRTGFRSILAAVEQHRPSAEVVHLFIAAPPSVCFVIGQELHLRSGLPVRTYRFRSKENPLYRPAILLRPAPQPQDIPLLHEEVALAADLRGSIWSKGLRQVIELGTLLREGRQGSEGNRWHASFGQQEDLQAVDPYPGVPPLFTLLKENDALAKEPRETEYAFDKSDAAQRVWRFSDRLILGFFRAAGEDRDRLLELVRLFFFHEYLHDYQALTKYTAESVGRFANCLERIDYIADSYALLHQMEFVRRNDPDRVADDPRERRFLVDQINLALRSFWAFDWPPPQAEMQERRVRRYLNWFWRRVQLREASSRQVRLKLLSEAPAIEISGLHYRVEGGRIYLRLKDPPRGAQIEIGTVLEDGRFDRRGSAGDLSLEALIRAFVDLDHDQVDRFFNSFFDTIKGTGGHLPPE